MRPLGVLRLALEALLAACPEEPVQRVEGMIVDQFERGGMTASAKQAIDRSLNTLAKRSPPQGEPGAPALEDRLERR